MNVSELAKELKVTNDRVITTLRSLKLKAKDGKQELSAAVISVIKSALKKEVRTTKKPAGEAKKTVKKAAKKKIEKKETKTTKKKTVKKAVKKKTAKDAEPKRKKKTVKKVVKKRVVSAESTKVKSKIGKGPLITLKPLARKKRKQPVRTEAETPKPEAAEKERTFEDKLKDLIEEAPAEPEAVVEQILPYDENLPDVEIHVPITVKDLSTKLQQKPSLVLKTLMKMGVLAHINQSLDGEVVSRVAREFGFNYVKIKTQEQQLLETHKMEEENAEHLKSRAPVVTFMGHVDHGKTSLLDRIRKAKVADQEHGGITQHIGAYSVELPKGRITFLDTPGHEAFTAMRARGAHITDIVVVVIAADEGIMPQTEEAIDHARAAGVPIVIALNKIDRPNADMDRVKKQLSEHDLLPEDWGGKTICTGVSAMTGEGIDNLLEMILLESELLELKANPDKSASGIVIEAHLSQGKGAITTLIVQSGTLRDGDMIVVGSTFGRVKAMFDDHERPIKEAGPSVAVEILGLPDVPEAGDMFYVIKDEKQARDIALKRQENIKNKKLQASTKITLEDLYSQIQEGVVKELNVIIKADVQGSLEALKDSLAKIPSDKVKIKFIHLGVGDVNASDVLLALASKAVIIAFHVGVGPKAKIELEKEPVDVRQYRIIYDAVDDMRNALEGLLEAKTLKKFLSRIEVREVFKLSKHGIVAGCYVTKGRVQRKAKADLIRNEEVVFSGHISSLKRFKDDVKEVNEGMECGITLEGFDKFEVGDIIEAYEEEKVAQKL